MNRIRLFSDAAEEVQIRAQLITRLPDFGEARKEYYKAFGYICALHDTGLFDSEQYGAASDLLNAAILAAEVREKKAAPDGSNTGNGSKGGHPKEDDSLNHNFSVDEKTPDVKTGGAYIIARSSGNGLGDLQTAGDTTELACACAAVISGLAGRLPKKFVIAAILTGCVDAGISVDNLKEVHDRV